MESRDSDLRKDSDLGMMNNSKNHNSRDQTGGSSHFYTVDHKTCQTSPIYDIKLYLGKYKYFVQTANICQGEVGNLEVGVK